MGYTHYNQFSHKMLQGVILYANCYVHAYHNYTWHTDFIMATGGSYSYVYIVS